MKSINEFLNTNNSPENDILQKVKEKFGNYTRLSAIKKDKDIYILSVILPIIGRKTVPFAELTEQLPDICKYVTDLTGKTCCVDWVDVYVTDWDEEIAD